MSCHILTNWTSPRRDQGYGNVPAGHAHYDRPGVHGATCSCGWTSGPACGLTVAAEVDRHLSSEPTDLLELLAAMA